MRPIPQKPPYCFDNDCIASFLWTKTTDLLIALFPSQIVVPRVVYTEMSYLSRFPRYAWVFEQLQQLEATGTLQVRDIPAAGPGAREFWKLTSGEGYKNKQLGKGEAAALVLVRYYGRTVASNNLKDVAPYCREHGLDLISTDDILCLACQRKLISVAEAEGVWDEMKRRQRKLPPYNFAEAYRRFLEDKPK
ncbi:MAG: hypothetical protein HPY90_15850 [Syntrophothermus sp.]|uniref:hypothetical protein n=1 Tax=Syntrophothermus sp. TaxID=2736299 RepID=UPI00257F37F2|nr:hypothetical protein [Syntrophothermus sp.]NSW84660.1 hypothetical protein [Syntrophothermus sp.]